MQLLKSFTKKNIPWPIICIIGIIGLFLIWLTYSSLKFLITKPVVLSPGQSLKAQLVVTPGTHRIGDLIPVTLIIEAKPKVQYTALDLANTNLGMLELKKTENLTSETVRGGLRAQKRFLVTAWETGEFPIANLILTYKTGNGSRTTFQVPTTKVIISSTLPKYKLKEELLALPPKDFQKPLGLPPKYQILVWFIVIVVGVLLIYWLIHYLHQVWPKKSLETEFQPQIAKEPAHLIAFQRLDSLKQDDYLAQGEYKKYYSELSECIREYIENRFRIPALEMTTEEFLADFLTTKTLNYQQQCVLVEFLKTADLVKFAKLIPPISEAENSWNIVYQLVDETKQVEIEVTNQLTTGTTMQNLEEQ